MSRSRRAVCLAVAVFGLLAVLPAARPAAQPAVAVLDGGGHRAVDLAEVPVDEIAGLDHLWVWTEDVAPQRVEAGELPVELRPAERHLTVHLPAGRRDGWELVAAPAAMWLDVPEALLPRWPVPEEGPARLPVDGEPWTLRLLAAAAGSWWTQAEAGASTVGLLLHPARDQRIAVVDEAGAAVDSAAATWLVGPPGTGRHRAVARAAVASGALELRALPDTEPLTLVVAGEGYRPTTWHSPPSALPPRLRLLPGVVLHGRFVDPDERPVAGVEVVAEGWAEGESSALVRRRATSGADGTWSVDGLPPGRLALDARKPGWVDQAWRLEVDAGRVDLDRRVLRPGVEVTVRVADEDGQPVSGATLRYGAQRTAVSGGEGRVTLRDLRAGTATTLSVSAEGFLDGEQEVVAEAGAEQPEVEVVLRRAFHLTGRVLTADGAPPLDAAVVVETGNRSSRRELPADGALRLDVEPGVPLTLSFTAPGSDQERLGVEPGLPGEVRDLGEVHLAAGHAVTGRVWSEVEGAPLAGARVWAPRSTPRDAALAWMRGDLVSTTTAADGTFTLRGLPSHRLVLRVDAPSHARRHLEVGSDGGEEPVTDLGDVSLTAGGELEVRLAEEATGAVARADLRGDWQQHDMVTAPVADGVARLAHLPAGEVLVTVMAGRDLLCETAVTAVDGELREVECGETGVEVQGWVLVGDRPGGEGGLTWRRPGQSAGAAVIVNQDSPRGARRQQVFGEGRPAVDVAVDSSGWFLARGLAPGPWEVTWMPVSGASSPPVTLDVPRGGARDVELRFAGSQLTGVVVDGEGEPVAAARVVVVGGAASAYTDAEGAFRLVGLAVGTHRLFARRGELRGEAVATLEEAGADPVVLTLGPGRDDALAVRVRDADGAPVPGALVVLAGEDGGQRIVTTDQNGDALLRFDPPWPGRLHAASVGGDHWGFTGWQAVEPGGTLEVRLAESGDLVIHGGEEVAEARLVSQRFGDLSPFLRSVGVPLRLGSGRSLEVRGLPAGTYTVEAGGVSRSVQLDARDRVEVELR